MCIDSNTLGELNIHIAKTETGFKFIRCIEAEVEKKTLMIWAILRAVSGIKERELAIKS